jgi:hypothetical protein
MLSKLYAKWMYAWETALTNRIVDPLEWSFGWLKHFSPIALEATPRSATHLWQRIMHA